MTRFACGSWRHLLSRRWCLPRAHLRPNTKHVNDQLTPLYCTHADAKAPGKRASRTVWLLHACFPRGLRPLACDQRSRWDDGKALKPIAFGEKVPRGKDRERLVVPLGLHESGECDERQRGRGRAAEKTRHKMRQSDLACLDQS